LRCLRGIDTLFGVDSAAQTIPGGEVPQYIPRDVRKRPARGQALARRRDGQPAHILAIGKLSSACTTSGGAWTCQRAKRRMIVAGAVARELAGFCWALVRAD